MLKAQRRQGSKSGFGWLYLSSLGMADFAVEEDRQMLEPTKEIHFHQRRTELGQRRYRSSSLMMDCKTVKGLR
jgi:hypothetical protein